jgi:hypothetical protein
MEFRNFAAVLLSVSAITLAPIAAQASTGKDIRDLAIMSTSSTSTIAEVGPDGAEALKTMYGMLSDEFYTSLDELGFKACKEIVQNQSSEFHVMNTLKREVAQFFHPLAKTPKEKVVVEEFTLTLSAMSMYNNCRRQTSTGIYRMHQ